jgi:hypothetical protein
VPANSTGGFGVNQQEVNDAASLMSNLTSSGGEVTKALGVLDPLVFGIIGSSTAAANSSMENVVLQCLQGVLNLFDNTSSDIGAAASTYAANDGTVADALSSLTDDTLATIPGENADIPNIADDMPGMGALPGGGFALSGLGAAGFAGEDIALGEFAAESIPAEFESSVLARLAGSEEMLGEFAEETESAFMSLFRSLGGPSEVSERWNGLTDDEQDEAIAGGRGTIGSLDGIPSEVRDLVNTRDLDDVIAETELQIKDLRNAAVQADEAHDGNEEKALLCLQQAAVLEIQIGGLKALRGQLAASPNAYLLGLDTDPNGTGRYILAINNPDTADNVATLVPTVRIGLRDGNNGISGLATAAINLATAASAADRSHTTAVVVWANYSAPHIVEAEAPQPEPQAAPVLAQFQGGLFSTNPHGARLHTTVTGTGTGSVLVGEAVKLPGGLSADDLIVLGSPGLNAPTPDTPTAHAGSSAPEGNSHVWLYADEPGGKGPAASMDYFSPDSRIMPDMAHVIVGDYEAIYYLEKQ